MDSTMPANTLYCEELLKTLGYIDPSLSFIKVLDSSVSAAEKDTLCQRNDVRCNPLSPVSCLLSPVPCFLSLASYFLPPVFCIRFPASCILPLVTCLRITKTLSLIRHPV